MRSRRWLLALGALVALAALILGYRQYLVQQLRKPVLAELTDPDSAQFRNERYVGNWLPGENSQLCGEVNAKNRMGGYTGYQKFYAHHRSATREDEVSAGGDGKEVIDAVCAKKPGELPWWWLKF